MRSAMVRPRARKPSGGRSTHARPPAAGRSSSPTGRFLTGAVRLKSNVNLHLTDKATLAFSSDLREYPIVFTRWEGVELMNFSPFIYAFETENIAVTGRGTLDGQADAEHWWNWRLATAGSPGRDRAARDRLIDMQSRASRSPSASSARPTTSGRISSSRIAAATC